MLDLLDLLENLLIILKLEIVFGLELNGTLMQNKVDLENIRVLLMEFNILTLNFIKIPNYTNLDKVNAVVFLDMANAQLVESILRLQLKKIFKV